MQLLMLRSQWLHRLHKRLQRQGSYGSSMREFLSVCEMLQWSSNKLRHKKHKLPSFLLQCKWSGVHLPINCILQQPMLRRLMRNLQASMHSYMHHLRDRFDLQ